MYKGLHGRGMQIVFPGMSDEQLLITIGLFVRIEADVTLFAMAIESHVSPS